MTKIGKKAIAVEALRHDDAKRRDIPTAESGSLGREEDESPVRIAYARRNRDLDPQLVWRGKDEQDWSDLIVPAPRLHIQERVHPKALIDDLRRESKERAKAKAPPAMDLFGDLHGLPHPGARTGFYRHDRDWSNRMILGDSLSVLASLAEREGLRGQVQCIYIDPPYGIRFNSNFQWSTTGRDVKDGKAGHVTREPEQVRAFRDTWRDGVHSYLTYLRDRLTVARDLLHESGSIFIQIGDENVHRVRALMDEVFGGENFVSLITTKKSGGMGQEYIDNISDYILWYGRNKAALKYRQPLRKKNLAGGPGARYRSVQVDPGTIRPLTPEEAAGEVSLQAGQRVFLAGPLTSETASSSTTFSFKLEGKDVVLKKGGWKTGLAGMDRLRKANRLLKTRDFANYKIFFEDFPALALPNLWDDTMGTAEQNKIYVVQTTTKVVQRCLLMTTDPGDLVLDPTCGAGTTAYVAEQWGRRWIAIDTSRVALALARARIMGARYPYYLLADTPEGRAKEAEVARFAPRTAATHGDIRQGFVYERVPHITLKSIANNAEIDVIWEKWQEVLEPLRATLNGTLSTSWQEWDVPRAPDSGWPAAAKDAHAEWWDARMGRQREIDASVAAKAEFEYLYDKPYADSARARVAGPFTVESLSPHRGLAAGAGGGPIDGMTEPGHRGRHDGRDAPEDYAAMILGNLEAAGVRQAHREDRIAFTALAGWPGRFVCAEGRFMEGAKEKRAGILIGPEFGTLSRPDLIAAAREAGDAGFDMLIACAFNYDAPSAEFDRLGRVPVLKARMNPELHIGDALKATASGNLFVVFGEPDIDIETLADGMLRVKINGIDVFKPQTGEIESGGPDAIALWMVDTDYGGESFFVRQAYFLGANDPYKALKATLKAEIDEEAWASLNSDISRPFHRPASGRIAVKVINHLGDEAMKVFAV